jgi:hypothetical protein
MADGRKEKSSNENSYIYANGGELRIPHFSPVESQICEFRIILWWRYFEKLINSSIIIILPDIIR